MSKSSNTLPKNPALEPGEDFYQLRREGIGHIEQMGSRAWTDYNVHDPGITLLEALCYALTDVTYRSGWDIADLLTPASAVDPKHPYPNQTFFSAREILTTHPVTPDDLRRLLIDRPGVRNAWILCKQCVCEASYFAWCEDNALRLAYARPENISPAPVQVTPRGLYEVLLELEFHPELGDLNDRKIEHRRALHAGDGSHPTLMELRFPDIALTDQASWQRLLDSEADFATPAGFEIRIALGAKRGFDLYTDFATDEQRDKYVRAHWRDLFHARYEIHLLGPGTKIVLDGVALRLYGDATARDTTTATDLKSLLTDKQPNGIIPRYRRKAQLAAAAVRDAKASLQAHRNLGEDFCLIDVIGIEEVSVCADVEVRTDADIEMVQARIWFEIEQYLNPPVPFHSLRELRAAGEAVEDIFDGPELEGGFIRASDLENASLKSVLRVSDILDKLMGIDDVLAVNQLLLTKYDGEGTPVPGAADPVWVDSTPVFDANKISAAWLLFLSNRHQPRLYLGQSRFLFYKNGLPFLPRQDEAIDVLNTLRGAAERTKNASEEKDIAIQAGRFRDPEHYEPVQYSLPQVYGVGPSGLPSNASVARRAQAQQLRGYLMVFEQLLANLLSQLAHTADLFSLDPAVKRTYFVDMLSDAVVRGASDVAHPGMTQARLDKLVETPPEFLERRNRFLDHLLARFGENFDEYALLLTRTLGRQQSQKALVDSKIPFLRNYATLSHDRARAFDYTHEPCAQRNVAGIKQRVRLLLDSPTLDMIVVEHVLLRPKFVGDALFPACCESTCTMCGDEDPYSFRLTFVMPGWLPQYTGNLDMRRYAERTLQRETPSHLLGKTCWVGNDGFIENPCDEVVGELADLLIAHSVTDVTGTPATETACACALDIYHAFSAVFSTWYADKMLRLHHADAVESTLAVVFDAGVKPANIPCAAALTPASWQSVRAIMLRRFVDIALHGWQFERFEKAWCEWLEENATIDWTQERLSARVQALLARNLESAPSSASALCECADRILTEYGTAYFEWMRDNLAAGHAFEALTPFVAPPITLCPGMTFKPGTTEALTNLLSARYNAYKKVSYRLWIVVTLLSALRNVYPGATLHDCDDGSDQNPVRLNNTALGNYPLRHTLT